MHAHRVPKREWSHAEGPQRYRVRLFQQPGECAGHICIEIRDWRQPQAYRYRTLSLGHFDRERAIRYAKVLSRYWRMYKVPPKMVWREGRGRRLTKAA